MKIRDVVILVLAWLLIAAALSAMSKPAKADRIDDARAQGPAALCEITTRLLVYGAAARVEGRPMVVKTITYSELDKLPNKVPTDAMYLIVDENTTEQEVDFSRSNMELGWRLMDSKLKTKRDGTGWSWSLLAQEFQKHCVDGRGT